MKLFSRYNRINLLATVFIFLLTMLVFYFFLRQLLGRQVDEDLEIEQIEITTYANRYHRLPEIIQQENQQIFYTLIASPKVGTSFKTIFKKQEQEDLRQVEFSQQVAGKWYNITISKSLEGTDHLTRSVATITLLTILAMLLVTLVVNRFLLQRLWQPFYETLTAVKHFRLGQREPLTLPDNTIDEFKLMNTTLQQAMQKAGQDYVLLKEFTENASHELQTPLAIIRAKLEILMQEPLSKSQGLAVEKATDAIQLLSRYNRSLLLLTKIQNNQFADRCILYVKTILENKLEAFQELLEDKRISVYKELENPFHLLNTDLANMLVNNLLNNAIKHNHKGGKIHLLLTHSKLIVSNTGTNFPIDENRIFTRFYNPAKAPNSTGLGLSIIKNICEVSEMDIQYEFVKGLHQFTLTF